MLLSSKTMCLMMQQTSCGGSCATHTLQVGVAGTMLLAWSQYVLPACRTKLVYTLTVGCFLSPWHCHDSTIACCLVPADVYTTLSKRFNDFQDKNKAAQYQRGVACCSGAGILLWQHPCARSTAVQAGLCCFFDSNERNVLNSSCGQGAVQAQVLCSRGP